MPSRRALPAISTFQRLVARAVMSALGVDWTYRGHRNSVANDLKKRKKLRGDENSFLKSERQLMRLRILAHSIAISKNVYSVAFARCRVFTQPRSKGDTSGLAYVCFTSIADSTRRRRVYEHTPWASRQLSGRARTNVDLAAVSEID